MFRADVAVVVLPMMIVVHGMLACLAHDQLVSIQAALLTPSSKAGTIPKYL